MKDGIKRMFVAARWRVASVVVCGCIGVTVGTNVVCAVSVHHDCARLDQMDRVRKGIDWLHSHGVSVDQGHPSSVDVKPNADFPAYRGGNPRRLKREPVDADEGGQGRKAGGVPGTPVCPGSALLESSPVPGGFAHFAVTPFAARNSGRALAFSLSAHA